MEMSSKSVPNKEEIMNEEPLKKVLNAWINIQLFRVRIAHPLLLSPQTERKMLTPILHPGNYGPVFGPKIGVGNVLVPSIRRVSLSGCLPSGPPRG